MYKPEPQLPPCLPDRVKVQAGWKKPSYHYGYGWLVKDKAWKVSMRSPGNPGVSLCRGDLQSLYRSGTGAITSADHSQALHAKHLQVMCKHHSLWRDCCSRIAVRPFTCKMASRPICHAMTHIDVQEDNRVYSGLLPTEAAAREQAVILYNKTFSDEPRAVIRHLKSAAPATAGRQPKAPDAHAGSFAVLPSAQSGGGPAQHNTRLGLHSYLPIPQPFSTTQQASHSQQDVAAGSTLCQSSSQATADAQLSQHQPAEDLWQHGRAADVPLSSSRLDKLQPLGLSATEGRHEQPARLLLPHVRQQMRASQVPGMPNQSQAHEQGTPQVRDTEKKPHQTRAPMGKLPLCLQDQAVF